MTTTRDTHSNPMGCVDEIRAAVKDWGEPLSYRNRSWLITLLAAYDAAAAERDQYARAIRRHKDTQYPDKRGGWIERADCRLYAVLEPGYIEPKEDDPDAC